MNLTEEIKLYLETVRHLWNSYLRRDADWDSVDAFKDICLKIYEEQIIARLNINAPPIPIESELPVLNEYRIYSKFENSLPLYVNRDIPPSGYWDHPINWIKSGDNHSISPICFYDFDVRGWRKMEYYRVRIKKCISHPELDGRDALIKCDDVEIKVINSVAEHSAVGDREDHAAPKQ